MAKLHYMGLIPFTELHFEATRSRGPGGQNVNMRSTAIILRWAPALTTAFTLDVRERLIYKLRRYTSLAGEIVIRSEKFRSHEQNRRECLHKLEAMIQAALCVQKPRKKTKPTRSSVEKRHTAKKQRAEIKRGRKRIEDIE